MKYIIIALILITGIGTPFYASSQSSELGKILTQTFSYEPLKSFLASGENDEVYVTGILTNNLIPIGTTVFVFGEEVRTTSGSKPQPYTVLLTKIRMKPERAKVKFIYHSNVTARMSLKFEEGRWKVHHSYIRMKARDAEGKKTKKMHWDF